MPAIDHYLTPLSQGVWEVIIPRVEITEPLAADWEKSLINIPSPGVIASYRKGQYHLHETKTQWKVHLDRFDPKIHPILHLIDDAPLLLMIAETFITIFSFTRDPEQYDIKNRIQKQANTWRNLLLLGVFSIILGTGFVFAPDAAYWSITGLVIPGSVFILGLLTIINGLYSPGSMERTPEAIRGVGLCIISGVLFYIPQLLWSVFVLILLGLWMFSSAAFLLIRIFHGRTAVPEGFVSRCIIGITSLIFGLLIFIIPAGVIRIFFIILGLIFIAFGISGIGAGLRLRSKMSEFSHNKNTPFAE